MVAVAPHTHEIAPGTVLAQGDSQGRGWPPADRAIIAVERALVNPQARRILDRAHLVLCTDKQPINKRAVHLRPTFEEVRAHLLSGGTIGIYPASLGYAVLDVDAGDPRDLIRAHPPTAITPSKTLGRVHLWYHDPTPRFGRSHWVAFGCEGSAMSATTYVIAWALPTLLDQLTRSWPSEAPVELLGEPLADFGPPRQPPRPPSAAGGQLELPDMPPSARALKNAWRLRRGWPRAPVGQRHPMLLHSLAKALAQPANWHRSRAEVRAMASTIAATYYDPLPLPEALLIADWMHNRQAQRLSVLKAQFSALQRQRALRSAQVRTSKAHRRASQLSSLLQAGWSLSQGAKALQVSLRTAYRYLASVKARRPQAPPSGWQMAVAPPTTAQVGGEKARSGRSQAKARVKAQEPVQGRLWKPPNKH